MKIGVLDDWQGVAQASADWSPLAARADITFFSDHIGGEDACADRLAPFDILLTMRERTPFPASLVARLPNLRMLGITGARNNSVDTMALAARGIPVCCTQSGEGGEATAELALGLMIAAARRLAAADATARSGRFQTGVAPGSPLKGRTLGVVGLGRLGRLMAHYGQALGMRVIAWSPNLTAERAAGAGVAAVDKRTLIETADVVSLHMVLSDSTRGLIGREDIGRMKPGAILVNTARGPLVDEAAMIEALSAGRIAAGLDVYAVEPMPAGHPLLSTPNTVLSPHLGYCVSENFAVFYRQSMENALAFIDGAPIRVINMGG